MTIPLRVERSGRDLGVEIHDCATPVVSAGARRGRQAEWRGSRRPPAA
jgi:hypothetical protein